MESTTQGPSERKGLERVLVDLALDHWRLVSLTDRLIHQLDAVEVRRYVSKLRFHQGRAASLMETAGFQLVSLQGESFHPGMAASALNQGDFDDQDDLRVKQMIEPVVMGPEGVVRPGTMMLGRVDE